MSENVDRPAAFATPGDLAPGARCAARWIARVSFSVAIVSLAWSGWASLDSAGYQALLSGRLDEALRRIGQPAASRALGPLGAARSRTEAGASGLIGRIEIERIGLRSIVVEGTGGRELRRAVGHIPGSAYPGEAGNVVLSGHRDTFFRPLEEAREGDRIKVTTPDGVFEYVVVSMRVVAPERVDVVASGPAPELTLITCYPFRYVGTAPYRYVVRGLLLSSAPAPSAPAAPVRSPWIRP